MKKVFSLLLVLATLFLLCSCGMTAEKVKDRLKEMEEDKEISYSLMTESSLKAMKKVIEDERYKKLKGDIEKGYVVHSKTSITNVASILIFEKAADAKSAAKLMKEEYADEKDYVVDRDGEVLIYGTKELVKQIKK